MFHVHLKHVVSIHVSQRKYESLCQVSCAAETRGFCVVFLARKYENLCQVSCAAETHVSHACL